jgi:hypothetical protein
MADNKHEEAEWFDEVVDRSVRRGAALSGGYLLPRERAETSPCEDGREKHHGGEGQGV